MRRSRIISVLAATTLALGACGGGDDGAANEDAVDVADDAGATDNDTDQATTDEATTDEPESDEPAADASGGGDAGGTATVTLDNGESFEFSTLCTLESQTAAGSEILFTIVSYGDPGLDITKFGDDGTITDSANISVYDGDFQTLWDAGTLYDAFGGTIELTLDGSTVRGSGSFYPAGDITAAPVNGEVVANC